MNGQIVTKAFIPLPAGATAVYTSGPTLSYFRHPDWLGSSRFASTPGRTMYYSGAYAPFGEAYAEAGTADRSFTAQNQDTIQGSTTGLYDFLFRQYAQYGRWISPDPAGLGVVDSANPQTWNRYSYVLNNPTALIDPLGLATGACVWQKHGDSETGYWVDFFGNCGGVRFWYPTIPLVDDTKDCGPGRRPCGPVVSQDRQGASSICSNLPSNGRTIPFSIPAENMPNGQRQINLQFNGQGALVGVGVQITGAYVGGSSNTVLMPNTFVGLTLTSPGTVEFGFNPPIAVGSGVHQAYFHTATFSNGRFTNVKGAWAPFTIPFGRTTTDSSILLSVFNGNSDIGSLLQNLGDVLIDASTLLSQQVRCESIFGGG